MLAHVGRPVRDDLLEPGPVDRAGALGAGGGIGRDIALQMAAQGAKVVVNDIGASVSGEGSDASPGQQVVDEIKAGDKAFRNGADCADLDATVEMPACT